MNESNLVTVIIPAYNIDIYFGRCISSVLKQEYSNVEIILVDDGSFDNTSLMCDEMLLRDKRIVVIHKKNTGLSDSRNKSKDISSGEYITYVDGDDWISLNYINKLLSIHQKDDYCFTQCSYNYAYNDKKPVPVKTKQEKLYEISKPQTIRSFVEWGANGIIVSPWGKMFKRKVANNIFFPVGKYHEDVIALCDIVFNKIEKVAILDEPLYYYYQREDSITHVINIKEIIDTIEAQLHVSELVDKLYPTFKKDADITLYHIILNTLRKSPSLILDNIEVYALMKKAIDKISISSIDDSDFSLKAKIRFYLVKKFTILYLFSKKLIKRF